uniref:dormancy-associated protein homolog 4 n=1 Tax=Erigeron canadensis TaxID=72917 RepID=UPI001CB9A803|nr:dormancy-associated protein homolog 4 [Erigeron canadensis]
MGFLDHLWDETLAGPTPDSGIGNLRKYKSLRLRSGNNINGNTVVENSHRISHSILQQNSKNNNSSSHLSSTAASPAGRGSIPCTPSTPGSPFSPTTPGGNVKKLSRRKSMHTRDPKSPTGYDWIVLSALDR